KFTIGNNLRMQSKKKLVKEDLKKACNNLKINIQPVQTCNDKDSQEIKRENDLTKQSLLPDNKSLNSLNNQNTNRLMILGITCTSLALILLFYFRSHIMHTLIMQSSY